MILKIAISERSPVLYLHFGTRATLGDFCFQSPRVIFLMSEKSEPSTAADV